MYYKMKLFFTTFIHTVFLIISAEEIIFLSKEENYLLNLEYLNGKNFQASFNENES